MVAVTDAQTTLIHPADARDAPWWRDAVVYQIYPRSFADSNGDGIGDLPGITARLPYLRDLGVDAVWVSPFYRSPMHDAGYDVADYRDIDPLFGTLSDADAFIAGAKELGLKVIVDLVPNHTSSEHEWFQAALAAGRGSTERARYLFRDGQGTNGDLPPNNWPSVFGGRGWSRVEDGQWYLHLFDTTQPDLDWTNPQVREEFVSVLRFWLDRGVDGFRVDVAHGMVKDPALPDFEGSLHLLGAVDENGNLPDPDSPAAPMWDQDGVHEIYRSWREVLNSYGGPDRIMCAEAWVHHENRLALYLRPDEMQQAFNFPFLESGWDAEELRTVITSSYRSFDAVGAPSTWVMSNHDVVRHTSRLGLPPTAKRPNGIGADDTQPDEALGLRRARAMTALMLALPGGAYLYQGEELGLPEHTTMPDEFRQDPTFVRTKGTPELELGRDGCRVPLPWVKDAPAFGFGPSERTWLPQPESYGRYAADQQHGVEGSTLELYRTLLRVRRELGLGRGSCSWVGGLPSQVVAAQVQGTHGSVLVLANTGREPVSVPTELVEGATPVAASEPLADGALPGDSTIWLRR